MIPSEDLKGLLESWRLRSRGHCAVLRFETRSWRGPEQLSGKSGRTGDRDEGIVTLIWFSQRKWCSLMMGAFYHLRISEGRKSREVKRVDCSLLKGFEIGGYS